MCAAIFNTGCMDLTRSQRTLCGSKFGCVAPKTHPLNKTRYFARGFEFNQLIKLDC